MNSGARPFSEFTANQVFPESLNWIPVAPTFLDNQQRLIPDFSCCFPPCQIISFPISTSNFSLPTSILVPGFIFSFVWEQVPNPAATLLFPGQML